METVFSLSRLLWSNTMRTICISVFTGVLLLLGSCADEVAPTIDPLPKIDTIDCPPPELLPEDSFGTRFPKNIPQFVYRQQRRSADGTKIACLLFDEGLKVTDIKTGNEQLFKFGEMIPDSIGFGGCFGMCWCPYDNNKLAVNCITGIDGAFGSNLFILSIRERTLTFINLPLTLKSGASDMNIFGWMKGSTPNSDSLLLRYWSENSGSVRGIVVLQEKKIVPILEFTGFIEKIGLPSFFLFSPDRKHYIGVKDEGIFIDGVLLTLEDTLDQIDYISWSPDSKKIAITGFFRHSYGRVGVVDVSKWLEGNQSILPIQKINFKERFCMYNLYSDGKSDAEFLTNTTLAVSMHHDGDMISPLWEITTDGRLLRQLTK